MSAFFLSVASAKSFEPAVLVGVPMLLAALALAACYPAAWKPSTRREVASGIGCSIRFQFAASSA